MAQLLILCEYSVYNLTSHAGFVIMYIPIGGSVVFLVDLPKPKGGRSRGRGDRRNMKTFARLLALLLACLMLVCLLIACDKKPGTNTDEDDEDSGYFLFFFRSEVLRSHNHLNSQIKNMST